MGETEQNCIYKRKYVVICQRVSPVLPHCDKGHVEEKEESSEENVEIGLFVENSGKRCTEFAGKVSEVKSPVEKDDGPGRV